MSAYTGGDPGADPPEEWDQPLAAHPGKPGDDLAAAVIRVRALHSDCSAQCGYCHQCLTRLPCATLLALDGS